MFFTVAQTGQTKHLVNFQWFNGSPSCLEGEGEVRGI